MAATSQSIPLCVKGSAPSLVDTDYANKVIRTVNAIASMKVAPIAGAGFFTLAGDTAVLDLTAFDQRFRVIEAAVANALARISNIENSFANLNSQVQNINATLTNVVARLDGASINASCDNAGTITVTLNL